MAFNPSSPVAGAAVPGFTSPTYTLTADINPSVNGKQWVVSAAGGTQVGVETNTVSKPFTISAFRPIVLKTLPPANPITGVIKGAPVNSYKVITRKGCEPASAQASVVNRITTIIDVAAGTDTFDIADVKAMLSLHIGALTAQSSGIADTVATGVL